MVKVICEKTGIEFEAATKRTKNHPAIMALLSEASRDNWYSAAMEALKTGRAQHLDTIETFKALLEDARDQTLQRGKYDRREWRQLYKNPCDTAIKQYMATYDPEQQPVEADFQGESSSINLLKRRLIRYCVKPISDASDMVDLYFFLNQECVQPVIKPMEEARHTEQRERTRQFITSLKDRPVVKEESYTRGAPYAGDYHYFLPEQRILLCSHSHFDKAPTDYLQMEDMTFCQFVEPTEEEKLMPEYQLCVTWMHDALQEQRAELERQAKQEARRQAELDAIRTSGRKPDLFDDIFAGTSDN